MKKKMSESHVGTEGEKRTSTQTQWHLFIFAKKKKKTIKVQKNRNFRFAHFIELVTQKINCGLYKSKNQGGEFTCFSNANGHPACF